MVAFLQELWPFVAGTLTLVLSVIASANVVLHKRDVRAAAGWAAVIWLVPFFGAVLYLLLGVNRIRRRAIELRRDRLRLSTTTEELRIERLELEEMLPPGCDHLAGLGQLVARVTGVPLTRSNRVEVLENGDEAFPAMLDAIAGARRSVALGTYIFDHDPAGSRFVDALAAAVERGVEVRVLIDSVGARYSWPSIVKVLRQRGIRVDRFLHSAVPWRMPYMNLRSHRKILVVDGETAFTGGMNIRIGHVLSAQPRSPVQDVHFRVCGPAVAQMMTVFAEDWVFTTREILDGDRWFPPLEAAGAVAARSIPDGPDEDLDKLRWTLLGALARAHESVRIVTPYFLPDETLMTSLNLAAMRGVRVEIVLPQVNNLPYVKWAAMAHLGQTLGRECRVFLSPPPFDHSKLMVVDGVWSLIGSANWDPRSLRLNFEFNLECYDAALAGELNALIDRKRNAGLEITREEIRSRPLLVQLRDNVARLATPYL